MERTFIPHLPSLAVASKILVAAGMVLMAADPVRWLANTWLDPSYDSKGIWVFILCGFLFLWSVTSPIIHKDDTAYKRAYILLGLTALVRCLGQVFAVNVIGALALVIDIYAIGLLLQVNRRQHALSPGWLAILFAFALPLERILQRTIGFGLQNLSAKGSCTLLQGIFGDVHCEGVRILIAGKDVLVDLPCSGARILILLCILYAALMSVFRPSIVRSVFIGMIALASAYAANVLRISLLSAFTAYPEKIGGVDIMVPPWHDITGLACLFIATMPMLMLAMKSEPQTVHAVKKKKAAGKELHLPYALGFLALAIIIVSLPRKPVDISTTRKASLSLPSYIQGKYGHEVGLNDQEKAYFTAFGGSATKMDFGDSSLMLIRTSSPLRHLHAPDECLRGMGFDVAYSGILYDPVPTALYTATRQDGSAWRIAVTFYSDAGHITTNVSEAVWIWMQNPQTAWHALQRITPLQQSQEQALAWDAAVFTALDLTPLKPEEIAYAAVR